jgi:hypothetical protein
MVQVPRVRKSETADTRDVFSDGVAEAARPTVHGMKASRKPLLCG